MRGINAYIADLKSSYIRGSFYFFTFFILISLVSVSLASAGIEYYIEPYIVFVNDTTESMRFEALVDVNYTLEYGVNTSYGTELSNSTLNSSHEFTITGLEPGTAYYYRLKIYNSTDSNETFSSNFTTSDSSKRVFKFAVLGDSRAAAGDGINDTILSDVLNLVKDYDPDLIIMTGDVIHIGSNNYNAAKNAWKEFTDIARGVTHYVPLFNAIGNHERISGDQAFRRYREIWMHPLNGDGEAGYFNETTFWIEYGNSLFIFLNTEEPTYVPQIQGAQKTWLNQTLQKQGYNNKFVFCHRPLRGTNRTGSLYKENKTNSDELDLMFRQYNVTAVFYGNEHYYCRHHSGARDNNTILSLNLTTDQKIYAIYIEDGRNDGVKRIYAGSSGGKLNELSFNSSTGNFTNSTIYTAPNSIRSLYIGKGRNDSTNRIYGTDYDNNVFEISWNGTGFENLTMGNGTAGKYMYEVVVGYGRNDSTNRVYSVSTDNNSYEFTWNGTGYEQLVVGQDSNMLLGLDIGYGRNDSTYRVYVSGRSEKTIEYTWNGTEWENLTVGQISAQANTVKIGKGRNDDTYRVYSGGYDDNLTEYTWNGTEWENFTVGNTAGNHPWAIDIGDGRDDSVNRIYAGCNNGKIFEYSWSRTSNSYNKEEFSPTSQEIRDIKIDKVRDDNISRVYLGAYDANLTEFTYLKEERLYHIVSGGAGAPLYDPSSQDKFCWGEEKFSEYHYIRVEVSGGLVNFTVVNSSGVIRDNFTQIRDITAPNISFSLSSTSFNVGDSVSYSCTATDYEDSSPDISVTGIDTTTTGTKTATCTATDDTGNSNSSNLSYTVTVRGSGSGWSVFKPVSEELEKGYEKSLRKNSKIEFSFNNKIHTIKLENIVNIVNKTAIITVSSEPVTFNLTVNETKKLNLDDDNYYDLQVFLKDITDYEADLVVKLIHEEITVETCEPDWQCSDWGECLNYTQKRTCMDLNSCNVTTGKPGEILTCCEPDWQCSEWTECLNYTQKRTCTDLNSCNITEGRPGELRGCKAEAEAEWWVWLVPGLVVALVFVIAAAGIVGYKRYKKKRKAGQ